jgi:phenylalanyl-tRNA synthetase beta chain
MKISYNWLKDYIDIDLPAFQLADLITSVGLEVEEIISTGIDRIKLEGLIIGEVLSVEKHPDADKLKVAKVNIGASENLQIVCGAANIAAGQKVVVAAHGTDIYPRKGERIKIKKSKIRGVVSEGMICAEDEIGLSDNHEGIMILDAAARVGDLFINYFKLENDTIFDIAITANRGDAMSHIGVARDVAAALQLRDGKNTFLKKPKIISFQESSENSGFEVLLKDTAKCFRFSGILIKNISVAESPEWLKEKLRAIGLRPINNVVDVTNFVMLECGQPLHAYDAEKISSKKIIVQCLPQGTAFKTLDGNSIKLFTDSLMVCNGNEPMCIAGIYGGADSGVQPSTSSIFLEAACWNPSSIRKTMNRFQLRTDAGVRFEKGTDPNGNIDALKRAALLICELSGGKIASELFDIYPKEISKKEIGLRHEKLNEFAGYSISKKDADSVLQLLSFEKINDNENESLWKSPTFKTDVSIEEDLIEEIIRILGYDQIPVTQKLRASLSFTEEITDENLRNHLSEALVGMGLNEMINVSFTSEEKQKKISRLNDGEVVRLMNFSNPGLDSLRTDLLLSGLEIIANNLYRKQNDLKLFEFGRSYVLKDKNYVETPMVGIWLCGKQKNKSWREPQKDIDLFYLKAVVSNCLKKCGIQDFNEQASAHTNFDYSIDYFFQNKILATAGLIDEKICAIYDVKTPVFYASIPLSVLKNNLNSFIKYAAISRFPFVRRDMALVFDEKINYSQVKQTVRMAGGSLLKEVQLFDIYRDEKLGAGKKQYAVSFIFEDESHTLSDAELDPLMKSIRQSLEKEYGATLRS